MKKLLIKLGIIGMLLSCQKENIVPEIGKSYHIKGDIFNQGSFQPLQPVLVDSVYIDAASGLPYARCKAQIDWANFALVAGNGVKQMIVAGNKIEFAGLQKDGINPNDTRLIEWEIPQNDLK